MALTRHIFADIYNQNFEFALTVDPAARDYLQDIGLRLPILAGTFNGVDITVFQTRAERKRDSAAPLRICWIGRLVPEKNAQLLPHLAQALRDLALPFELVVIGDGSLAEPLRRQLPTGSQVEFTGWLAPPAVAAQLARADVYLSVSDTESCSLTANEALASGVPVMAPDAIGFRRLAALGAGLLFPTDWLRPSGMRKLAAALRDSQGSLAEWSRRAAALAPTLSWEAGLHSLYTVLETQLGQRFL
jgi:phosphatidylinositol alpha 1,6-mannosyltransferase